MQDASSSVIEKPADMKYMSEYIDAYRKYMANAAPSHRVKGTRDVDFGQGRHEIEFRNVSFRYPNSESYVLKNISLKIKSGEHLSLVGYNGSGKSTFVKLLCRLYEPTSALDPVTEYDIFNRFHTVSKGKTAIYISHRLSSSRFTDKVALLRDGTLAEFGTHEELMTLPDGIYREMFRTQARYYV